MMNDNRLELLKQLTELQERKIVFRNMFNDTDDYYFKKGFITLTQETKSFNKSYNEEKVEVNKELFKFYLSEEINMIESKITKLLEELK